MEAVRQAAPLLSPVLPTHTDLFEFVSWYNKNAWDDAKKRNICPNEIRIAQHLVRGNKKVVPLWLHHGAPEHKWVSDPGTLGSFLERKRQHRKREPIPAALRNAVWNVSMGGPHVGSGPCFVCSKVINQQDFECGHIVSQFRGGKNILDNLRPICRTCNRSMGTLCLKDFKEIYFDNDINMDDRDDRPSHMTSLIEM